MLLKFGFSLNYLKNKRESVHDSLYSIKRGETSHCNDIYKTTKEESVIFDKNEVNSCELSMES